MKHFIVCLLVYTILGCSNQAPPSKKQTAHKVVDLIMANKPEAICGLIGKGLSVGNDTSRMRWYVKKTKEHFEKYGIPPEKDWYIKYDTLYPTFKLEVIVIPIFKGYDPTNGLEQVNLELGFDYTGRYLTDEYLADFYLNTKFRPIHLR